MANAKKTPTKRTPAKKTAKTTATRRKSPQQSKKKNTSILHGSFVVSTEKAPFMSFRLTDQTLYWAIFSAVILALGLWVLHLHLAVEEIYNSIELNHAIYNSMDVSG